MSAMRRTGVRDTAVVSACVARRELARRQAKELSARESHAASLHAYFAAAQDSQGPVAILSLHQRTNRSHDFVQACAVYGCFRTLIVYTAIASAVECDQWAVQAAGSMPVARCVRAARFAGLDPRARLSHLAPPAVAIPVATAYVYGITRDTIFMKFHDIHLAVPLVMD